MNQLIDILKGKKTYIIAIVAVVLGTLEGFGVFAIPDYIWPILGAAGLGTIRAGVTKVSGTVKGYKGEGL